MGSGVAEAGPDGIVVESYVGARPADADQVLAPLIQEMRRRKYQVGAALGQDYDARVSRPSAGSVRATFDAEADAGIKQWAQGKFEDAVATLQPLVDEAQANPGALIAKPRLADAYLKALTGLGLSKQRLGDPAAAREAFDEVVRSFPTGGVARSTYGPQAAADFDARKKQVLADPKGRLAVKTADDATEIYINERLERRGFTEKELVPGTYRVVAKLGSLVSRVHRVEVRAGEERTIQIDPAFDSALRTAGWAGFSFESAADSEDHEAAFAARFGTAIGAPAVVVVSIDDVRGSRAIVGALVQLNGKEIRRASLALAPAPSQERFEVLARFLVGENVTTGIDVELDGAMPVLTGGGGTKIGPRPERPSAPASRWVGWPVITSVVALGAIGVSAYYLSKDGDCKDGSTNPACEPVYETKTGAIIGFAGGGVMAALTVYLIVTWPSAPKSTTAFVAPAGVDGAVAGISGSW
ncbi:MAG: hypothetical protein JNL83_08910 [Myxococcales bacterium]|nr:hypothetical protein [Myxococcales bacterium]